MDTKNFVFAVLWFSLSTIFTWWFVRFSSLYVNEMQMVLSSSIAGGKWAIQILAALILLDKKSWLFIRNIGFVCFAGSCILLPYVFLRIFSLAESPVFFISSLIASVLIMIVFYYRAVRNTGVNIRWWLSWLGCLAIAISLQLTVVFRLL
jgi:hypothetical protein